MNIQTILVFFFILLAFPALAADTSAYDRILKEKTLRCGYVLYPPYIEKDLKTGKFMGPAYDVAEEVGKTLGWKLDWVEEVAVGAEVAALQSKRIDAICAVTGDYDPGMISQISFSVPFFFVKNTIYARAGDKRFEGPQTFASLNKPEYTFAGIEGDASLIYAKMLFPKAKTKDIPQLSDTAQMFLELSSNKADLIVVEPPVAARAMKNNPQQFYKVDFTETLPAYGQGFAVAKDALQLKDTLSQARDYMNENDMIDPILHKHDPKYETLIRVPKAYKQ